MMNKEGRKDYWNEAAAGFDLLIVEEDPQAAATLQQQMRTLGHRPVTVDDGRKALDAVASRAFDLIILERRLPGIDGIALLNRLRQANVTIPIVMLSVLGQAANKIEGLNAGADDYLVKPVDPGELDARLRALRRARRWLGEGDDTLRVGDLVVSPTRFRAWRAGKPLDLANIEFKLLTEFVRSAGNVLTRPMLLERVWHYDFEPATNIVDAYVRRLRRKLAEHGGDDPIMTLRGVGYKLRD